MSDRRPGGHSSDCEGGPGLTRVSLDRLSMLVRDLERGGLFYVCRVQMNELVVITVYEEGGAAAVPNRFTDALRLDDECVA